MEPHPMRNCVQLDGRALRYGFLSVRSDHHVVLEAAENWASAAVRDGAAARPSVRDGAGRSSYALFFASEQLRADGKFIYAAVSRGRAPRPRVIHRAHRPRMSCHHAAHAPGASDPAKMSSTTCAAVVRGWQGRRDVVSRDAGREVHFRRQDLRSETDESRIHSQISRFVWEQSSQALIEWMLSIDRSS
eukprot:COSAG01_NODE_17027_length_1183_cov_125.455720_2_plen_189_part_00